MASDIRWGDWGRESGGDIGASTEVLVVRKARAQSALAHAPRRAVPDSHASRAKPGARCSAICSLVLVVALSLARRRRRPLLDAVDALAAHDAAALAPMPSSLQAPSLSAAPAARLPLAQPSTPHLCVANARACVR